MADQSTVPGIPNINVETGGSGFNDLSQMLGSVAAQAQGPLPPQYIQGKTVAEPRIDAVVPYQPRNTNNQPLTTQATELARAHRKDAFNELANIVGKAGQAFQMKKQENLKEDLKSVMSAKTNIANAESVLQQDPNNAMAKQVMEQNKKSLEAILSDPKKQKMLAKALDVSFTDPEKNKTPEVMAYQKAMQEHKEAGAFNSDNPAEHQVAQRANELGDKLPAQQPQQPAQAQQPQQGTPRANQVLAKDLPGIQNNPQYAVALKQQEEAQKRIEQYIIPRMIQEEGAKQIQAIRDGHADARVEFKALTDFTRDAQKQVAAMDLQDKRAKDAMNLQARKDSAAMARTMQHVNASLKIAEDKRLDPSTKKKLETEALAAVDKDIASIAETKLKYDKAAFDINADTNMSKEDKASHLKEISKLQDYNTMHLGAMNEYRSQVSSKLYGAVAETNPNAGAKSQGAIANSAVIGSDSSDESDTDSDDYGDDSDN